MIRPTSSPDVNRMAMNVKNETGTVPVHRRFRQRNTSISDVSNVTLIAMLRISATPRPDPSALL